MSISADGQHIWAANRTRDAVQEFGRPGSNGLLPLLATVHVGRGVDGIAIARSDAPGGVANNVFVNDNDGTVVRIDTNNGNHVSVVASGGSRGDFATVGPDGCFYVTQTDRVVKLAPCFFQSPTADLSVVKTASVSSAGILQPQPSPTPSPPGCSSSPRARGRGAAPSRPASSPATSAPSRRGAPPP